MMIMVIICLYFVILIA